VETFAAILLVYQVLADGFKPKFSMSLEKLWVVRHYFKYEDFDVEMSGWLPELLKKELGELRHLLFV
jgi:hypothetical protein